jgi:murein DD-endopeptidase MepM/ murein hydrolase activator NlpD
MYYSKNPSKNYLRNDMNQRYRCEKFCFILSLAILTLLCYTPAVWSLQLILPETAYQGDLIIGQTEPESEIHTKDNRLVVAPQGYFVLPVPRNQKNDIRFTVLHQNQDLSQVVRILAFPWRTQNIKGLPKKYVTPTPEQQQRVVADIQKVRNIRKHSPYPVPLFLKNGFQKPLNGPVTSPFGLNRILNGMPKQFHSGVDFRASLGQPVKSPADGIVRMVDDNMYLMGKTLILDHGLGVTSIYMHLNKILVSTGDLISQGQIMAQVGKTGRATGAHLHWGVNVGLTPIDPLRLLNRSFP